jgi:hypothetical protein
MARERKSGVVAGSIVRYLQARPRPFKDRVMIIVGAAVIFALSARFDVFNKVVDWMYKHDTWQLDELFTVAVYLVLAIGIYAVRRNRELKEQIRLRERAEQMTEKLIPELESARADIRRLRVLVPICSSCKRVRGESGYWEEVETYVEVNLRTRLDHGLCPDCARQAMHAFPHEISPQG